MAKAKAPVTTDESVAKILSEEWALIVGNPKNPGEMSRIVKKNDREFIIGYVLTESVNKQARSEDLARGLMIVETPRLLSAALAVIEFWQNDSPVHPGSDVAKDLRRVVLDAIGSFAK